MNKLAVILLLLCAISCKPSLKTVFTGNGGDLDRCSKCGVFKVGGQPHQGYIFGDNNTVFQMEGDSTTALALFDDRNISFKVHLDISRVNLQHPDTTRNMADTAKGHVVEIFKHGRLIGYALDREVKFRIMWIDYYPVVKNCQTATVFEGIMHYVTNKGTEKAPFGGHLRNVPYWLGRYSGVPETVVVPWPDIPIPRIQ